MFSSCLKNQRLARSTKFINNLSKKYNQNNQINVISCNNLYNVSFNLNAQILSGKKLGDSIKFETSKKVSEIQSNFPHFQPKLSIIQVGSRPDSSTYVRMKLKAAKNSKIHSELIKFDEDVTETELLFKIDQLNNDINTNGILIQLPLPKHINEARVTNAVIKEKDVDGFTRYNAGELAKKGGLPFFIPCTPNGVIKLLKSENIQLSGAHAVVVGRSNIVGTPVAALLRNEDCTVTICHSKTKNIPDFLKSADIVIACAGSPDFIQGSWLKEGCVVIDVGMNYVPDSSKKSGQRPTGDVDFESAKKKASFITPVPGGVGPMTIAMLIQNVFLAAKAQNESLNKPISLKPLSLKPLHPVPSDIDISRAQQPYHITQIAKKLSILPNELDQYGHYKAKVSLDVYDRLKDERENAHYILVAGITPTPLGEGKSTTTMGLVQALGGHLNLPAIANVRQPSMGPTFGVKGGAAGGGYAQVIPMDEFNMHLTGDIHAIGAANNLLAAAIDTRIFHESTQSDKALYKRLVPTKKGVRKFTPPMLKRLQKLGIEKTNPDDLTVEEINKFARLDIDPESISIKRVVDVNDRFLRQITIGQAPTEKGLTRKTGFDITVASEIMAILALSKDLHDLRNRVGNIVIGLKKNGDPVTCDDIFCGGAITALLKDTIKPNLMQTLEGTPVFVHAGPFANISIGASSVIADKLALKLAGKPKLANSIEEGKIPNGYVVTEAGFDFTMGGERFFNIKCRSSGYKPSAVVIVATVRALKLHGGAPDVKPGQSLPAEYTTANVGLVKNGCCNLAKQISNAKSYDVPVIVAINQFETDTPEEIAIIKEEAKKAGAFDAVESNHWAKGGAGSIELANTVVRACEEQTDSHSSELKFLYDLNGTVEDRLKIICQKMYGADDIELSPLAKQQIEKYIQHGFGHLPICIAKTQYSLSHDPKLKGVPTGFKVPIREVRISAGAGYLYALAAEIMTIPGLSTHAGFMNVEVKENGEIDGLF
ncbi:C-1-tetrahydrofolate synthase [Ascoidea rubescens DSM 1968]|uniref:Methylenetetrahydrofolate dehydrogenase n=1 Tax=Ascoidea rubescens DSM 1968 TaxID=1344418 RepID=A0A1D2VF00_9ASCO|nr:methylenetetrahydrofolate dehydrogenase [Ascoidea rubescens DSM 1968]ODV60152.1 methylenetetrahydrofolate dehydrogenase [Ascoidea rubescens DSM 1968]